MADFVDEIADTVTYPFERMGELLTQSGESEAFAVLMTLLASSSIYWSGKEISRWAARNGFSRNRYEDPNYHAYITFTDYDGNRQSTNPRFVGEGPQIALAEMFKSHSGQSYILSQFKHARGVADFHAHHLFETGFYNGRYRRAKDMVLVLERMREIKGDEKFQKFWETIKDPWSIYFRAFYEDYMEHLRAASGQGLPKAGEQYEPVIIYPCLVDEPSAVFRNPRAIIVTDEQVEAGVEALPDKRDLEVLAGKKYVRAWNYNGPGKHHKRLGRLKTMRELVSLLQDDYWREELGLLCPGHKIVKKKSVAARDEAFAGMAPEA